MSDSTDRRDWFVANAAKAAREVGQTVDVEAVGRDVGRHLDIMDRVVASGALDSASPKPAAEPKQATKSDAVQHAAAKHGATVWESPIIDEGAKPLPKLYGVDALKLAAMERRIRVLCKQIPGYTLKPEEPIGNMTEYPRFANLLFMHMIGFSRGAMSYKGLSLADRQRKYNREVEKICDQSDAVVGHPWWVR